MPVPHGTLGKCWNSAAFVLTPDRKIEEGDACINLVGYTTQFVPLMTVAKTVPFVIHTDT